MAPVTEIATMPLSAGATIEDINSPAGKVWQSTLDTVSAQDGFQRAYYGREIENPNVLQLFIDWDSLESHQDFMKSTIYGPFGKLLMTIVDGNLTMYHASFGPNPASAALSTNNPVTEVVTFYLTSKDDSFDGNVRKYIELLKDFEGFRAASAGWIIEDVQHEKLGSEKKGKAFVAVVGWDSVEAHIKARETDACQKNIHLVREGPVANEMHHTTFNDH